MEKRYIEFIESPARSSYTDGDRVWRPKKAAQKLVDAGKARFVTEEEQEALQQDAEVDAPDPAVVHVVYDQPHGKYAPGDKTWVTEAQADRLSEAGIVKKLHRKSPAAADNAEKQEALRSERAEQLDGLEYGDVLSRATAVAKRVDAEPDNKEGDTLKAFILDHWSDYKAVTG